jgi:hypothetical protein
LGAEAESDSNASLGAAVCFAAARALGLEEARTLSSRFRR